VHELPERANMLSGPLVGATLRALVHAACAGRTAAEPPRILELGTFTGYATAWLLDCLPAPATASDIHLPGHSGCVVSCELKDEVLAVARENLRLHPRFQQLRLMQGPAIDSLRILAEEAKQAQAAAATAVSTGARGLQCAAPFDLVYIDANKKSAAAYASFLLSSSASAPPLLRPGTGVLVLDNTLWKGLVAEPDPTLHDSMTRAAHQLNQQLRDDPRLLVTMLPIRDGITVIQQRATG